MWNINLIAPTQVLTALKQLLVKQSVLVSMQQLHHHHSISQFLIPKATPPTGCSSSATSDFVCTGEGVYPDPLDCKKYHYCYADAGVLKSQQGACSDRYVFDPDASDFCRYTNNYYCTLPNCKNVNELKNLLFTYTFYPYNRQYVALCVPNAKPLVFKCDSNYTPNLSTIPITCNFKCKSPGQFPVAGSTTQYYNCIYNDKNQLTPVLRSCFIGWTFVVDRCQPPPVVATTSTTASSTIASTSIISSTPSISSTIVSTTAAAPLTDANGSTLTTTLPVSTSTILVSTSTIPESTSIQPQSTTTIQSTTI
jgi:hypothetical protein